MSARHQPLLLKRPSCSPPPAAPAPAATRWRRPRSSPRDVARGREVVRGGERGAEAAQAVLHGLRGDHGRREPAGSGSLVALSAAASTAPSAGDRGWRAMKSFSLLGELVYLVYYYSTMQAGRTRAGHCVKLQLRLSCENVRRNISNQLVERLVASSEKIVVAAPRGKSCSCSCVCTWFAQTHHPLRRSRVRAEYRPVYALSVRSRAGARAHAPGAWRSLARGDAPSPGEAARAQPPTSPHGRPPPTPAPATRAEWRTTVPGLLPAHAPASWRALRRCPMACSCV